MRLESLAQQALQVAKKAKKHRQNLANDNYYGNKLAELRADAANAFRELSSQTVGDTTALAELTETVFAAPTASSDRLSASRELIFALRTTWREPRPSKATNDEGLFPLAILVQANRGYLVTIGRQMNGCFDVGWYDGCAVMMRRLVEICIIEAFEHKKIAQKIKTADGNYVHLTELVTRALTEPALPLTRNAKKLLPPLRDVGHLSAHGRYFLARKEDLEKVQPGCRVVVEEFLHHAGLLS
ncbi:MAG: hypothetical protein QY320_08275 [Gammaproteobacteria bacterium]|nr:MAG: hypothetical protein QY320_08275 [Gammaproteobacteria bacterium]